jgi:hypothetical protein
MKSIFGAHLLGLARVGLDVYDVLVVRVLDNRLQVDGRDLPPTLMGDFELYFFNKRNIRGYVLLEGDFGAKLFDEW